MLLDVCGPSQALFGSQVHGSIWLMLLAPQHPDECPAPAAQIGFVMLNHGLWATSKDWMLQMLAAQQL